MKYFVTLHAPAECFAVVEVDADDEEEAKEKALEEAPDAEFEFDNLNLDHVSVENVSCEEEGEDE